jgi:quercetin dioxygenase-like cupin family protein
MLIKAASEDTGGRFAFWQQTHPAGYDTGMHVHTEASEAMYVLAGEYELRLGDESRKGASGAFVLVPSGVPHGFTVGPEGGDMLVLFAPGGYERYWTELAEAEKIAPITEEARIELARLHGTIPAEEHPDT